MGCVVVFSATAGPDYAARPPVARGVCASGLSMGVCTSGVGISDRDINKAALRGARVEGLHVLTVPSTSSVTVPVAPCACVSLPKGSVLDSFGFAGNFRWSARVPNAANTADAYGGTNGPAAPLRRAVAPVASGRGSTAPFSWLPVGRACKDAAIRRARPEVVL